jgi:ribonucleotide monophosphatase NagD (HAD superfamily)
MEELVAQKKALENQWNTMLMSTGVYTIEMKEIESRIDAVKKALILQDIARVKNTFR